MDEEELSEEDDNRILDAVVSLFSPCYRVYDLLYQGC
jgi:hypothetical protein